MSKRYLNLYRNKVQNTADNTDEADNEAVIIPEKSLARREKMDEKEKWKVIMDYMSKNPRTLVDALPEPGEEVNRTMYNPIYDEIIDQENQQNLSNMNNSNINQNYDSYEQDALALGAQNHEFGDEQQENNINIVSNSNSEAKPESMKDYDIQEQRLAYTNISPSYN